MSTRKNTRKYIWWGMGILVVASIVTLVLVIVKNNANETFGGVKTELEAGEMEKEEKKNEEEPVIQKEEVKQYDGGDPNMSEELTGVISYTGVNDGNLIVRVNIDQYLLSGNCELSLMNNSIIVYSNVVAIEDSVSTSTCSGFSIPISELPSGSFIVEVILKSGNKYGKISGEVVV